MYGSENCRLWLIMFVEKWGYGIYFISYIIEDLGWFGEFFLRVLKLIVNDFFIY